MALVERVRDHVAAHAGDALVAGLVLTAVLERLVQGYGAMLAGMAGLWGVPLLLRRRFPLLAPASTLLLIAASLLLVPSVSRDTAAELLLSVTAAWMLTADNPPRRALLGVPAGLVWFVPGVDPEGRTLTTLLMVGAAVAGWGYRRDRVEAASLQGRREHLERHRHEVLEAAVAAERDRIARELHDIVAHSVSVMTVQAGAARMQLDHDPRQALTSIAAVEVATTAALDELERLVGLLGPEEREVHVMADLEALVARMRDAGLDVRLDVEGAMRPLAGGLDLALYRIAQEALTNARKHGGAVRVDVRVHYAVDEVHFVADSDLPNGEGSSAVPVAPEGQGLIGMRERAVMYGGRLEAGPNGDRFHVDVRVPTS